MVVDSSAIVALLTHEPEAEGFLRAIQAAESVRIAALTLLECEIVIGSLLGAEGVMRLDELVVALRAEILAFGDRELAIARSTYRAYGKGRHAAALNFGDCFSYAAAIALGEPLLYKGADFSRTDVISAV